MSKFGAQLYNARRRRKALFDPASGLFRTHVFTTADTNIDTAAVFGDSDSRTLPITFAFSLLRTGTGDGIVLEFGSDARGLAVWVDGADLNVAAGAGTVSADDGITLNAADALPLATSATGTLTLTGNAADGETVSINGRAYTFQDALTNVDGNVLIGASASDTLDNLIAAINLSAGSGTLYAALTVANDDVSAAAGSGDTMDVTALIPGDGAHSVSLAETVSAGQWNAPALRGGSPASRFVVSVNPGVGTVGLYRNGLLIGKEIAVNGDFGGAWADTDNGAIGDIQNTANDRVPGGNQIPLANVDIIGGVSVYLHQRAGA